MKQMNELLPYEIIERAVSGDTESMCTVLKHFNGLICKLSMIPVVGSDGAYHLVCDADMKRELEVELITQLPRFDVVNG